MMFLTVIFNILAITTAIRVPTAWPEQEKRIALKAQKDTYNFNIDNLKSITNQQAKSNVNKLNGQEFYTPKLEQQTTDAGYLPHFILQQRRPSGSHAFVTNNKKSQYPNEKLSVRPADVRYSVPQYLYETSSTVSHANVAPGNKERQNIDQIDVDVNQPNNNHKSSKFSQSPIYVNHNANFPTSTDGWIPITGQHNPHKIQESNHVYAHHNLEGKHNQNSNRFANRRHTSPLNMRRQYKNANDRQDIQSTTHYEPSLHYRVLNKNYRDDKTHEPSNNEEITKISDETDNLENENDELKEDLEKLPVAEHEIPRDIPTKPIYPGEGQWAIPGHKHQPFISNHRFTYLNDDKEEKPEGFETFQKAEPSFERKSNKFSENLQYFPHALGEHIQEENAENKDEEHEEVTNAEEEAEEAEGDDFVPTRTLAQVRKTENEEHLPSDDNDARLREVIKDSKIHTVYTEEGYEDIAYDHAGHEKNAEDSEGQEEFDKDAVKGKQKIPKRRKPKSQEINVLKEFENYEDPTEERHEKSNTHESDAEVSASDYGNSNPKNNMKMKEFVTTKENKTTEIKNMDEGDVEMEITSEIKVMTQPNNAKIAHKFVKIVPKTKNKFNSNDKKLTPHNSDSFKIVKRRKRFVNDFPKIQVEKDFLDVFNNDKAPIAKVVSTEKYPYYSIRSTDALHNNSPLRYSEDMKNIPKKVAGRMTFYEQSKISECAEIPRNVNPIPNRVQKAQNKAVQGEEATENEDVVDLPDVPRLRNLGDKIDCLKLKLFGENPLDSPIFQEAVVEQPESIFDELDSIGKQIQHEKLLSKSQKALNEAAAISKSLISQAANEEHDNENQEDEQQSGESADLSEDYYEDSDADYQTKVHNTIVQDAEITVPSTSSSYYSLQNADGLVADTSPERELQVTVKPALAVGQLIVSTTTFATKRLPDHIDEKVNLIPKHIYDQIDFAENFETTTLSTPVNDLHKELVQSNTTVASFQEQIVETTEKFIVSTIPTKTTTTFVPKHIYDKIDAYDNSNTTNTKTNINSTTNYAEVKKLTQSDFILNSKNISDGNNNRQPKAFDIVTPPDLSRENKLERIDNNNSAVEALPETAALRMRRRRRKRPAMLLPHIFDVNRFLPTPLPPLALYPTTNTVLPKYKILSEVYYKDEIKPNEQLNVFADVINNIKNSPPEILHAEGSENFETVQEHTWKDSGSQKGHIKKLKIPPRKIRIKHNDATKNYYNSDDTLYITSSTTSTTVMPPRRRRKNKYKNHKSNAQVYEEYLQTVKENEKDHSSSTSHSIRNKSLPKGKPLIAKGHKDNHISEDASSYDPVIDQDLTSGIVPEDVFGLNPPFSVEFPAVYPSISSQNSYPLTESTTINTFPVLGMKPPSNRKPLLYSDFRLPQQNRIRRRNYYHRIRKRSPYKPSYSEIRRNKPASSSEDEVEEEKEVKEEEEEDDYVPKRNRNFHYDVENDRVVYINKKEEEPEPQIEEQEEEEEEEKGVKYLTLERVTPKPKFVVITTERNGPSFLEYVQQLKNNTNYRVILDPKPTEKPTETTTKSDVKEGESTTTKQVETIVPAFLNIISKLKSNENYKEIRDKKEKSTTTTAAPEEEEEDDDDEEEIEELNENVRNAPGGSQNSNGYDRTQIFDISEYLPQPKTVIDYSKYKTIERAPVSTRHSLSSRYNSEDDDLPLSSRDTTQVPILETSEDNVKASSSEQESGKIRNRESDNRRSGYSSSEERVEEEEPVTKPTRTTTALPEVTTTQPRRIPTRRRKRPTTTAPKPTTTTTSAPISRKRTRQRSRPTTTTEPALEENYSHTQRVVHRRLPIERYTRQNQKIPPNHKAFYTPIVIEEQTDVRVKPPVILRKRKVSRLVTPNRIQLTTNSTHKNPEELGKPGEIQPRKLPDVQVFKKYDSSKKHGGNYRREFEDPIPEALEGNSVPPTAYEIENSKEIKRLSDVVPKPFAFYSDPTLPKSVNQLKEPKIVEELPSDSEESEIVPNSQEKHNKDYSDEYDDEVKINFTAHSETATKTPVYIVKDPSKRLYYYAPVK